jgi:t-SNARE complex subunit (syntaxin)
MERKEVKRHTTKLIAHRNVASTKKKTNELTSFQARSNFPRISHLTEKIQNGKQIPEGYKSHKETTFPYQGIIINPKASNPLPHQTILRVQFHRSIITATKK